MKKIYAIFLLGLYAVNISAAGAAQPQFNDLRQSVMLCSAGARDSIGRLLRSMCACEDIVWGCQMFSEYGKYVADPSEKIEILRGLLARTPEDFVDQYARKELRYCLDAVMDLPNIAVPEFVRSLSGSVGRQANAWAALGREKTRQSEDLELDTLDKIKLFQEGDALFLGSIELYARAARLGDDASLQRLTDLLDDKSMMREKTVSFIWLFGQDGMPKFTKWIKRVDTKQVHMDLALAKLNRSKLAVADAWVHLDAYYDGAFQKKLREAMTDLSIVTPKSNWEQVVFHLFNRNNPPAHHAFMDAYKRALAERSPHALNHQKLMRRFVESLRANHVDPKSHHLVETFLAETAGVSLDFPEVNKLLGIFESLVKGDKLVTAQDIHLTLAVEKLSTEDFPFANALAYLNTAYNGSFVAALPAIMANSIEQNSLLDKTILELFKRKHVATQSAFLGAYNYAISENSPMALSHQRMMVRFMAKLEAADGYPKTNLLVKEFLAATAGISTADADFYRIHKIFMALGGQDHATVHTLVSRKNIHLTLALENLKDVGSPLTKPLSNLDKAYHGNFNTELPEIINRILGQGGRLDSLEGKTLVALLRRGYQPAHTAFINAYDEAISTNGNVSAFQTFMRNFIQNLPVGGQVNALVQEFLDKTASIQVGAPKHQSSMDWLRAVVNNLWVMPREETRTLARPFLRKWAVELRHANNAMSIEHLVNSPLAEDHEILRRHVAMVLNADQATPDERKNYIECLLKSSVEEDGALIRPYLETILNELRIYQGHFHQIDPRIKLINALLHSPLDSNHTFLRNFIQQVFTHDLQGHDLTTVGKI